jgi:hypothetical protein
MTNPAPAKAHFDPNHPDAEAAKLPNQSFVILVFVTTGSYFIEDLLSQANLRQRSDRKAMGKIESRFHIATFRHLV